ncbi:Uncharacterised protein [Yersinia rohdei]|uniref:Uncharacterized protein n=1 Tax=Yersinia rohdei TaxID=29485 RepID=A0A0U1HYB9_YERRO|nr:hypothetical protein [Yersinia rohdei]CQI97849.1 Uncharacterised protein [Yersinia rohdei]
MFQMPGLWGIWLSSLKKLVLVVKLKRYLKKTSKLYQGQSVYLANKPVGDYIQKGDQFYLDAKHKDHIEVFDSTGTKVRAVLNLDGSFNDAKTKAAKAEGRRLPK